MNTYLRNEGLHEYKGAIFEEGRKEAEKEAEGRKQGERKCFPLVCKGSFTNSSELQFRGIVLTRQINTGVKKNLF